MFKITEDQIIEEMQICPYCMEIAQKYHCCGEADHFVTGYVVEGNDVEGNFIPDILLLEDEFEIVEPNELTMQEKNDILGSLEYDKRGDR
jgi:hypothetical protein